MNHTAQVLVDQSAFPDRTRARILSALRNRKLDPALLYTGWRQTSHWISLHNAISPARRNVEFQEIYLRAFEAVSRLKPSDFLHLVSLGCGDGSKDRLCLDLLRKTGRAVFYSVCDISLDMALTASSAARRAWPGLQGGTIVSDLLQCSSMPAILREVDPSGGDRLVLFLGTLHNYFPAEALRSTLYSVRSQDLLLVSANLAPETNYHSALESILHQYNNPPTMAWLWGALSSPGFTPGDGELSISVSPVSFDPGLRQIRAQFDVRRPVEFSFLGEQFSFNPGESIEVFGSTRFIRSFIPNALASAGLAVLDSFITANEEEGVWVCQRASPAAKAT